MVRLCRQTQVEFEHTFYIFSIFIHLCKGQCCNLGYLIYILTATAISYSDKHRYISQMSLICILCLAQLFKAQIIVFILVKLS